MKNKFAKILILCSAFFPLLTFAQSITFDRAYGFGDDSANLSCTGGDNVIWYSSDASSWNVISCDGDMGSGGDFASQQSPSSNPWGYESENFLLCDSTIEGADCSGSLNQFDQRSNAGTVLQTQFTWYMPDYISSTFPTGTTSSSTTETQAIIAFGDSMTVGLSVVILLLVFGLLINYFKRKK